jgi:hypothetical protein
MRPAPFQGRETRVPGKFEGEVVGRVISQPLGNFLDGQRGVAQQILGLAMADFNLVLLRRKTGPALELFQISLPLTRSLAK